MNRRILAIGLALALLAGCRPVEGASDIGDPYAPELGNGGYDAQHYTLSIDYDPPSNSLAGTMLMKATASQALRSLDLDFRGMAVASVEVNGAPATFERLGRELKLIPERLLARGRPCKVLVRHHGSQLRLGPSLCRGK